ncbi:aldose 1-epimerase family protein [Tessaracoccus palaemonis]|uniref:Aldose 1-epimerase family protein n=1 Tax=Tessaracoccus palaemonis TaxID=2829499 RepID=A0ABX8SM23_9ACTN|nr:aldose 1-epimerase family protein [Tessaracoccus palaemonis]QXT63949.1 aldose 1-epimerase family protein [Tessaracoccus palaemonis]
MTTLPTGLQYSIAAGRFGAVVTEVGATLRSLTIDGDEVLSTFAEDQAPFGSRGRQLVPWPNRIRDGRYSFDGVDYQLPITEVPRNTALHGLGDGVGWRLVKRSTDEVVLAGVIFAQAGWNAVLEVEIGHRLDPADGLIVTVTTTNIGGTRAPYGYGAHPYIQADLATAKLTHTFSRELIVDPVRLLPIELAPVSERCDFRGGRVIGDTELDTAFAGVEGAWSVTLETGDRRVEFWADGTQDWGQIYTDPSRQAIAIEPMTCGPDAFNDGPTHDGVIVLEPGETTSCSWGIIVS